MGLTTISISTETRDRLRPFGEKGESWTTLLNRVMDELYIRSDGFYKIPFDIGPSRFGEIEVLVQNGVPVRAIMDMGSILKWKRKKLYELADDEINECSNKNGFNDGDISMSLVHNIKRTKLEPGSIRKVGDEELFENETGSIMIFKITGILSSSGMVSECRNDDVIRIWSTVTPYIKSDDGENSGFTESESDTTLENIKKTMPAPTEEQLHMLKKLEFDIGYINGEWKRITDIEELAAYHPECRQADGTFVFSH